MPSSSRKTNETVRNFKRVKDNLKEMDREMFMWEQEQRRIKIKKLKNRIARKKRAVLKKKNAPKNPVSVTKLKSTPNNVAKRGIRRPQKKTMIAGTGKFTLWVKPGFKVTSVRVLKRRLIITSAKDKGK